MSWQEAGRRMEKILKAKKQVDSKTNIQKTLKIAAQIPASLVDEKEVEQIVKFTQVYLTKIFSDGTLSCNCKDWSRKKTCVHTMRVSNEIENYNLIQSKPLAGDMVRILSHENHELIGRKGIVCHVGLVGDITLVVSDEKPHSLIVHKVRYTQIQVLEHVR